LTSDGKIVAAVPATVTSFHRSLQSPLTLIFTPTDVTCTFYCFLPPVTPSHVIRLVSASGEPVPSASRNRTAKTDGPSVEGPRVATFPERPLKASRGRLVSEVSVRPRSASLAFKLQPPPPPQKKD